MLELARAIGYELRPGVAASTHLAFTVEAGPAGAGRRAWSPAGTQVQSVPGQGELPQTFETGAEMTAVAALNELRLRTPEPQEVRRRAWPALPGRDRPPGCGPATRSWSSATDPPGAAPAGRPDPAHRRAAARREPDDAAGHAGRLGRALRPAATR